MSIDALYILGRTDLASMTGGMFGAHCAHAAKVADWFMTGEDLHLGWRERYARWCAQTAQRYGTVITLNGGNLTEVEALHHNVRMVGFPTGMVQDPEYPVQDGAFTHLVPTWTCGWAFGSTNDLKPFLGHLPWYP